MTADITPMRTALADALQMQRALTLQVEWGADECLLCDTVVRLRASGDPVHAVVPSGVSPVIPPAIPPVGDSPAAWRLDLAASDGAGLAATASHLVWPVLVWPQGDSEEGTGKLLVLAEAPGPDEDRNGRAFVGPAGQLTRKMLASIGIFEADVMLAYVVPWRPPGGRPPNETEIAACLPFLHRLLCLTRPCLALALGSLAGRALTSAVARRRRWTDSAVPGLSEPFPVLSTAAPGGLLQQPSLKAAAWAELRMLRRRMNEITVS